MGPPQSAKGRESADRSLVEAVGDRVQVIVKEAREDLRSRRTAV